MEQNLMHKNFDQSSNRSEGKPISWLREWTDALEKDKVMTAEEIELQASEMRAARRIEIAQCEAVVAALGANLDRCEHALAVAVAALAEVLKLNPHLSATQCHALTAAKSIYAVSTRLIEHAEADVVAATRELENARARWSKYAVVMFMEIRFLRRMNGDWSKFCAPPLERQSSTALTMTSECASLQ